MNMLRMLKLSRRLAVLIAIFSAGFIVYGVWSFKVLNDLKVTGPVYQKIIAGKDLVGDVLPPPEYILESYLVSFQLFSATEKAGQDKLIEHFKVLKSDYDKRHEYWSKAGLDPDIAEALLKASNEPALAFYNTAFNEFIPAVQKQDKEAMNTAMAKMKNSYETHLVAINHLVDLTNKRSDEIEQQATSVVASSTVLLLVILVISLGLGIGGSVLITRSIIGPIKEAIHVAEVVASRDLTGTIETRFTDEPGQLLQALQKMSDSLSETVGLVRHSTNTIEDAAKEIAQGNMDLSSRTEAQASSLEETAASMEELTSTVKHNSDNALQANTLAKNASQVAVKGGAVVSEVIETMGAINDSSKKIVDIISVIDGIAFQTNILALNAAVEAARAGEQGRGFAVVASEVRTLAQRSAAAAKEIKELIGNSVTSVEAGSKLVNQAGSTMTEVVESIRLVTDIMSEITAASQEQSRGINQINQAVVEMDNVTQQNSALVEQAAAAAGSLQQQTVHLGEVVKTFKLNDAQVISLATSRSGESAERPVREAVPQKLADRRLKAVAVSKTALAGQGASGESEDWDEF
ncbi:methyl-accepting chemotaxis protein [Oxalobacteraceae bacterium GrIS 2.11]